MWFDVAKCPNIAEVLAMKRLEMIPFVTIPVGWMTCVACSDFKRFPGRMWLGVNRSGEDMTIECPVCHGTGQVTRVKHIDARTGEEIDYERPGQRFVAVDGPVREAAPT